MSSVDEKRRPIVVARGTPRKRLDRGVGRWAGRLVVEERRLGRAGIAIRGIVVRGRPRPARLKRRDAFQVKAVVVVARSRPASRRSAREPPPALARADAAPAPAPVPVDASGVERIGARAAAAAVHQEHHGKKDKHENRQGARRAACGGGVGRGRGHARVVAKGRRLARAIQGRRVRREEVVLYGVRAGCVERSGGARVRGVFRDVPKELSVDVAPHTPSLRAFAGRSRKRDPLGFGVEPRRGQAPRARVESASRARRQ